MAPASTDDQFKFLISCIRYSNNGKVTTFTYMALVIKLMVQVDFQDVANECGIVSKGAAAKRYERMMKAHGIHQSQTQSTIRDTPVPSVPRRKPSPGGTPLAKKRKHDQFVDSDTLGAMDDDEDTPSPVKTESAKKIKAEPFALKDGIKAEPTPNVLKTEPSSSAFMDDRVATFGVKNEASTAGVKKEPNVQEGNIKMEHGNSEAVKGLEISFAASTGLGGSDDADDDVIFNDFLTPHPFGEPVIEPALGPFTASAESVSATVKPVPESIFIED